VAQARRHEQQRIARGVHDGLGQELSGASLLLRAAMYRALTQGIPSAAELSEINSILDDAIARPHHA
jgi:signal transduction histidine kinase